MAELIFTSQAEAESLTFHELQSCVPSAKVIRALAPGIVLISHGETFGSVAEAVRNRPSVYIRHLCPVEQTVRLRGDVSDVPRIAWAARALQKQLTLDESVSVQTRILDNSVVFKPFDVNTAIAEDLTQAGFTINVQSPAQALSIVAAGGAKVYIGASKTADNRSDWAGGCRRFAREQARISRAEFKLLEALELFKIPTPAGGQAIDLGAAPGGWTHVLHQRGMKVAAVDPAKLDPRLFGLDGIVHHPMTAQEFLLRPMVCSLLVNDMKMDSDASVELMNLAVENLSPEGYAILTLKLPSTDWDARVHRGLKQLSLRYEILDARQLFHNRSEVTCALRPRAKTQESPATITNG